MYGIRSVELNSAFDEMLLDDEVFAVGRLKETAIHLLGYTPDHIGYIIGSNVFLGNTLFNTDVGSAKCDFSEGSATGLCSSIQQLLNLPEHYRLYTGNDYPPPGREAKSCYNVSKQEATNKYAIHDKIQFVK
jgi:glyoxylase-like metal-dependent hydrolase (beta-lactamase superfamily II)